MGCVNATSAAARHDYQCQGELLRRRRRFGVFREYIDARTRVASDGAKLLPYALVPVSEDICCPDAWESPDIINVDLPEIVMEIAKELGLGTIPFREAIGECLRRNQNFTSPLDGAARDTG